MKIIGIIAEYNPFHLGHLYQIKKIKEKYTDSLIIAIISTNFTERGDISILNKWHKTKICLDNDIDLVIELPTLYATQAADQFARAALSILNNLKVDTLIFGSESDDVDTLINLANIQLKNNAYDKLVKEYLKNGLNYPSSLSKALHDLSGIKIDKPNDLLALSYIKEIIKNNYQITPIAIKRTNDYHGKTIDSNIISASLIRSLYLKNEDITPYIPKNVVNYIEKNANLENAFNYLKHTIIVNSENLNSFLDVDEGIENRIIKGIKTAKSWEELIHIIKTKRYTYNKINRMLIHILLGIKKDDCNHPLYLRILGFNHNGQNYLNKIKKDITIPIYNGYRDNINKTFDIEFKSTYVYSLITNNPSLIDLEYKNKPIIK